MISRLACAVAACLLTVAHAAELPRLDPAAAGFDPVRLAAIDGLVEEALAAEKMPGCVVCIGRRGGIALLRAYGRRAVRPERRPGPSASSPSGPSTWPGSRSSISPTFSRGTLATCRPPPVRLGCRGARSTGS